MPEEYAADAGRVEIILVFAELFGHSDAIEEARRLCRFQRRYKRVRS